MKTNRIGLDIERAGELAESLNGLLSDFQIYYQNLRGFHWNVRGSRFFVLHAKFEELYNDAVEKIDEVAERILTLGGKPLHSYMAYARVAIVKPVENLSDGDKCLEVVAENISVLIKREREILRLAAEVGDDGTQDLLTPYIAGQEKLLWMLDAYLSK